jgi:AcrR family transcriptional regulator
MFKSVRAFSMMRLMSRTTSAPEPVDRNARRKAETRARILAAARHLFATQGVEATTIREIARSADIALGGFYNYFRTKEDVLADLLREVLGDHLAQVVVLHADVDDVAERVAIAHRHLLAAAREDADWGWLLVRLEVSHDITNAVLGERAMADLVDGVRSGRFATASPEVALQASGGALLGVMPGVLRGEYGPEEDCVHAEGVLRSFGVSAAEAAEIARRPLPPLR